MCDFTHPHHLQDISLLCVDESKSSLPFRLAEERRLFSFPPTSENFRRLGDICFECSCYAQALRYYTQALQIDSSNPEALSRRSVCYLNSPLTGSEALALKDAERTISLRPNWYEGYKLQGDALMKFSKPTLALESYKKAYDLNSSDLSLKSSLNSLQSSLHKSLPKIRHSPGIVQSFNSTIPSMELPSLTGKRNGSNANEFSLEHNLFRKLSQSSMSNISTEMTKKQFLTPSSNFCRENVTSKRGTAINDFPSIKESGKNYEYKNIDASICNEVNQWKMRPLWTDKPSLDKENLERVHNPQDLQRSIPHMSRNFPNAKPDNLTMPSQSFTDEAFLTSTILKYEPSTVSEDKDNGKHESLISSTSRSVALAYQEQLMRDFRKRKENDYDLKKKAESSHQAWMNIARKFNYRRIMDAKNFYAYGTDGVGLRINMDALDHHNGILSKCSMDHEFPGPCAWLECILSLRFDLDIGPVIETSIPPDILSEAGFKEIVRSVFPDSNKDEGCDLMYPFTIRDETKETVEDIKAFQHFLQSSYNADDSCDHISSHFNQKPSLCKLNRLFGTAFYRQKFDDNVPRGFVQQLLVIISRLPLWDLQDLILRIITPWFGQTCLLSPDKSQVPIKSLFFPQPTILCPTDGSFPDTLHKATQRDILQMAFDEISKWPNFYPNTHYHVPLFSKIIAFSTPSPRIPVLRTLFSPRFLLLPELSNIKQMSVSESLDEITQEVSPNPSMEYRIPSHFLLHSFERYVTHFWELLITYQPILILANNPSTASSTAIALTSLILPLVFTADIRPYITLQDPDIAVFSHYGTSMPFPKGKNLILGTTNVTVCHLLEGWTTVLYVSDATRRGNGSVIVQSDRDLNHSLSESKSPTCSPKISPALDDVVGSSSSSISMHPKHILSCFSQHLLFNGKKVQGLPEGHSFESKYNFLLSHKKLRSKLFDKLKKNSRINSVIYKNDPQENVNASPDTVGCVSLSIIEKVFHSYFHSLTTDFLGPINIWFAGKCASMGFGGLCLSKNDGFFNGETFLDFLRANYTGVIPSFMKNLSQKNGIKLYEKFSAGNLFDIFVSFLRERELLEQLKLFNHNMWFSQNSMETKREIYEMILNLVNHRYASLEQDLHFIIRCRHVLSLMKSSMDQSTMS